MNYKQRKAHKFIWLLLLIIIPTIMFFSIKDLDLFSSNPNNSSQLSGPKKTPISIFENDIVKASVYESKIEIILKKTLKNASSVVYEINSEGKKGQLIGQLTTAGIYDFNIHNLPKGIIIYDDLKQAEITKLSL